MTKLRRAELEAMTGVTTSRYELKDGELKRVTPTPAVAAVPLPPPAPVTSPPAHVAPMSRPPLTGRQLVAPFLLLLIFGTVAAFAIGKASGVTRPGEVATIPVLNPGAFPLPTATHTTPPPARVTDERLPVVCQDNGYQRGYTVPGAEQLHLILTRHDGKCIVGGGTGWTAEEQEAWKAKHP